MKFVVVPSRFPRAPGRWVWELVDGETGQVFADGCEATPKEAREAAKQFRNSVYMAPIEMGT